MSGAAGQDHCEFPTAVRAQVARVYDGVHDALSREDWAAAAPAAREILRLLEPYPLSREVPWPVHLEKAWSYFALGMAAQEDGRLRDALARFAEAADVAPRMAHPSPTAAALEQMGLVYARLRKYSQAERQLRKAIGLHTQEPQKTGVLWLRLGRVCQAAGRMREAIGAYHRALQTTTGPGTQLMPPPEWTDGAYAGIVASTLSKSGPRCGPMEVWLGSGAVVHAFFVVLSGAALVLLGLTCAAIWGRDLPVAVAWGVLLVGAVTLLLLPVLRKFTSPWFSIELRDDYPTVLELTGPPTETMLRSQWRRGSS